MHLAKFILHKIIDDNTIERVIAIKQSAWPYPLESQKAWIKNNLHEDDIHVILMEDGKDVAYLNLCEVTGTINGTETRFLGIGNVCASVKRKGYGNRIMQITNDYLKRENRTGLLFCHSNVEPFYVKCGWNKVEQSKCKIEGISSEVFTYIFNNPEAIETLVYNDRLF